MALAVPGSVFFRFLPCSLCLLWSPSVSFFWFWFLAVSDSPSPHRQLSLSSGAASRASSPGSLRPEASLPSRSPGQAPAPRGLGCCWRRDGTFSKACCGQRGPVPASALPSSHLRPSASSQLPGRGQGRRAPGPTHAQREVRGKVGCLLASDLGEKCQGV